MFIINENLNFKKMRNISKLLSAIIVVFAFSCAKEAPKNPKLSGDLTGLPSWVLDPEIEDGIAAVGIASPSRGGIKFQIPKAEIDAKANIAATIQSDISRITKDSLREAKVNDVNDVEEFFSQASKEVVKDIPLSGVKRINIFQGKDGTLYVHMALKERDLSKYLKNSRKLFEKRLEEADFGRENINRAEQATKNIFDELEKERLK